MTSLHRRRIAPYAVTLMTAWLCSACVARVVLPPPLIDAPISRTEQESARQAYDRGLLDYEAADYRAAASRFTEVVERYPASRIAGLALYWQGRTQYQLGDDALSSMSLRRYLQLAPTVPNVEHAALLLANGLYNTRAYDDALTASLVYVRRASPAWIDEYVDLASDLMSHLPRPTVEQVADRTPRRNYLAPFYLQAARWAHVAGDTVEARDLAARVLELDGLPEAIAGEARALAGADAREVMTRPRLGLIAPAEGRFAEVSEQVRRGIALALEDINLERTVPIIMIERATASEPDSTIEVIRELARSERVEAILGPLTSEFALPAGRTAHEEGVPLASPTATDARMLEIAPTVFTTNPLDGSVGHAIGTYAARALGRRRFAILAVDDAYGRVQTEAFAAAVEAAGASVVARRTYRRGETQFTDPLGVFVRAQSDAVFVATNSVNEALRILNQMAFYELETLLPLGTGAWNDPSFIDQGRSFVEGYFADTFSADPGITRWDSFSSRYEEAHGEVPRNRIAAWGYDAARLALGAFETQPGDAQIYRGAAAEYRITPQGPRPSVVIHRIVRGSNPTPVDR